MVAPVEIQTVASDRFSPAIHRRGAERRRGVARPLRPPEGGCLGLVPFVVAVGQDRGDHGG